MRSFKLWGLLIVVGILVTSTGTAALSSLSLEREVSAGTVLSDTDPDVSVKFENLSTYNDLMLVSSGKVEFNLNAAIGNSLQDGFNTDAEYAIGTAASPLFKITNNSDVSVTVSISGNGVVSLMNATGSTAIISPGQSSSFYFEVNTTNVNAGIDLTENLTISS